VGNTYFITAPRPYGWDDVIAAARPVLGFTRLLRVRLPEPLVFGLGTVLGAAAGLTGKPALLNKDKANELVQDYWVCCPEKAERELGFVAGTTLTEGIVTTLQWYQRKGWL